MSDELVPDPLATLDQTLASQGDFAKIIRAYYVGLVAAGFAPQEALYLTSTYQTSLVPRRRI